MLVEVGDMGDFFCGGWVGDVFSRAGRPRTKGGCDWGYGVPLFYFFFYTATYATAKSCVMQGRQVNVKHPLQTLNIMKRRVLALAAIVLIALAASACSHKTCPAYRGSIAENVTVAE